MNAAAWLGKSEALLRQRGVPEPRASAEFLLSEVLGVDRGMAVVQGTRELTAKQAHHFWEWTKERARRTPLAYIVGHQPFLGLEIRVTRDCLIPRPETEELVLECERIVRSMGVSAPKIIEVGTGSGCISIALAQLLPLAEIFATDIGPRTLRLAEDNAVAHNVHRRIRFVREDLFAGKGSLGRWADLLVSNPPYIPTADLEALEPEVRAEPLLALDGGPDGLRAIGAVVSAAPRLLKPGGCLVIEIESRQGRAVLGLLRAAGFAEVVVKRDAAGLDRIAVGRKMVD